ncbi:MAG: hypothetical protein EBX40_07460 [Gammaproteobacteria bacterium]|nr:hypothetical protein [Gammaproteobacteria bacterium]
MSTSETVAFCKEGDIAMIDTHNAYDIVEHRGLFRLLNALNVKVPLEGVFTVPISGFYQVTVNGSCVVRNMNIGDKISVVDADKVVIIRI